MRCVDAHGPLRTVAGGMLECASCGGLAAPYEWVVSRWPRTAARVAVETRQDAAPYRAQRACPACEATLTPLRIDTLEVWLERCPACETTWVPRPVRATLERLEARGERREQVTAQPPAAVRQQVTAITARAGGVEPREHTRRPRVSPTHAVLALLGFPVVTGTERMRDPLATWFLALGLVAVYAGQFAFGSLNETLPLLGWRARDGVAVQLLTAVVAHAGWLHLLGNVYFLVAFGDGVEQYLPRWLVVAAFFVLGSATLAIEAVWSDPDVLFVGASGGVAVLMGACAVLQPRATVVTRIVVFVVPVRMVWYIAMEVALQSLMAWRGVPGVAWIAHLAGLGLGIALGAASRVVWGRAFA